MSNVNESPATNDANSRIAGEPIPEEPTQSGTDAESVGTGDVGLRASDWKKIAEANAVNDPPVDTTVMLPCMHWGTVSHKTGDRLVTCHCGQLAVIRAVQRTVTKYIVAESQPALPLI